MGFIYKHTNKINGKVYIGQTVQNPQRRWSNGTGYVGAKNAKWRSYFGNAILKYGWDKFEHEIICECNDDKLDELEKYYISFYNSTNPKYGYNIEEGGAQNRRMSQRTKEKLRELNLGEKNHFYGKHHTEEAKEKQRKNYKYHVNSGCFKKGQTVISKKENSYFHEKHKKNIVAININTGEVIHFKGIKYAARQLGLSAPSITRVLHKRRKATGGYKWFFEEEYHDT